MLAGPGTGWREGQLLPQEEMLSGLKTLLTRERAHEEKPPFPSSRPRGNAAGQRASAEEPQVLLTLRGRSPGIA